ncbi:nitroreductase family protein [Treponema primitia ZAS-2]|uniref:Nitroreductase family protein n=1 Tax=Treponema primitia (strain ATCC BAA-887 / DSM 12427 / ZAS-2) TaxID=545694 RepID=F5YNI9_TREPZ|nr:nitroreductase family protein [Treponema primitia]AEF84508.1 nitroreductase family protein [Treponema primitia ZAS-2]
MTFKELALSRYSVRKYKDTPVEREKLNIILETGRIAPTAANKQPQRILAVTGAEGLKKIDASTPCRNGAPAVFIVCYDTNLCWVRKADDAKSGEIDASIVTTQLMYQAVELGLGTLWVMHFDPAVLVKEFNIPENLVPAAILMLGYPGDDASPADRHGERAPLEKTVFWEKVD